MIFVVKHLMKITNYCLISFSAFGIIHSIFVIIYATSLDIKDPDNLYENLENKKRTSTALSIAIQVLFFFGESYAFFILYNRIKAALTSMMEFHDYLTAYKLTPRSRILKKHLPSMSMVMEEESNLDQSVMTGAPPKSNKS